MRKTITLALAGLGLAAAFAPLTSASAYCDRTWYALTGDCNPCYTIRDVTNRPMHCLD